MAANNRRTIICKIEKKSNSNNNNNRNNNNNNNNNTITFRTNTHHHTFSHHISTARVILYYLMIMTCITSQFLSVDAIRCHQCNSHMHENCVSLRSNSTTNQREEKYLRECTGEHNKQAFCRKTVLKIEVNGEQRVIRGCGWMYDRSHMANNSCFSADNEGYTQIICACHEDGCNGANFIVGPTVAIWTVLAGTAILQLLPCAVY